MDQELAVRSSTHVTQATAVKLVFAMRKLMHWSALVVNVVDVSFVTALAVDSATVGMDVVESAEPQVPFATVTLAPVPFDDAEQRRFPQVPAGTTVCVPRSSVVPTAPTASM